MPGASGRPAFLVVKLADIGDVLTATPALRALRLTHPEARLDVLTSRGGAAVLAGSHHVDSVLLADRHVLDSKAALLRPASLRATLDLVTELRRRQYDRLLLLHHLTTPWGARKWQVLTAAVGVPSAGLDNGRGGFLDVRVADRGFAAIHEVEHCLSVAAACGAAADDASLAISVPATADATAQAALSPLEGRFAVVHPGSGGYSLARRWPPERFAVVADAIAERHALAVVLVGGRDDSVAAVRGAMRAPALDLSGRTDLMTLAAVLQRCAVFVGNDSGVMHLACAVGAPLVAIFGPTDPRAWGPWRPGGTPPAIVVAHRCRRGGPCLYVGHSLGLRQGCPDRDCLLDIGPEEVLDAVARALG